MSNPGLNAQSILPDTLVSTEWLEAHLGDPSLIVADIRGYVNATPTEAGRETAEYIGASDEYAAAHIPGSVFVDWTQDIIDPDDPIPVQIAPPELFKAAMEVRGIGDQSDVVVVDQRGGHFASRLWWALRYYGHDRVSILNGGFDKWQRENRPLTSKMSKPSTARFTPKVRPQLLVDPDDILAAGESGVQVLDARDHPTYTGELRRHDRGGHIPGALHAPAKSLVNADGTWRSTTEIREILQDQGVNLDEPVIAYCNGGVTATNVLFALDRLGHDQWANYDGSWNEWGERYDLPVKEGIEP